MFAPRVSVLFRFCLLCRLEFLFHKLVTFTYEYISSDTKRVDVSEYYFTPLNFGFSFSFIFFGLLKQTLVYIGKTLDLCMIDPFVGNTPIKILKIPFYNYFTYLQHMVGPYIFEQIKKQKQGEKPQILGQFSLHKCTEATRTLLTLLWQVRTILKILRIPCLIYSGSSAHF